MPNTNDLLILAEMMGKKNAKIKARGVIHDYRLFNPTTDELLEWLNVENSLLEICGKDDCQISYTVGMDDTYFVSNECDLKQSILNIAIQYTVYLKDDK